MTPCHVGKSPSQSPAQYGSSRPSIGVTAIQPTFCIVWTVVPTMTTSTQVIRTPGRHQHLLVREPSLERDHEDEDRDDADQTESHALEHRQRSCLERHRLQEEHGLEALPVDAREAEEHEADGLRGDDREAGACEDAALSTVERLQVLLPVHAVVEPVQDQEQDADRDDRDDRLQLLPVDRERRQHGLRHNPRDGARDECETDSHEHRPAQVTLRARRGSP